MTEPVPGRPRRDRPPGSDVRAALLERDPPLDLLVEGLLGVEARIDWACRCPRGGVTLVHWAEPGHDLAGLTHLLAQLSWLEPRLADWQQLAPERNLDANRTPAGILLARTFSARAVLAANALGGAIQLGRWTGGAIALESDSDHGVAPALPCVLEPEDPPPSETAPSEWASHFRTRLRHEDL